MGFLPSAPGPRRRQPAPTNITPFEREDIPWSSAFLAGRAFLKYRRAGGVRSATLPDFFIVAHAQNNGYAVMTRDAGRYRTYFPQVELIAPEANPREDALQSRDMDV